MNQRIPADNSRRIHLHGVGDVARPVDIDSSITGFKFLKSLRIYCFLPDQVIDGEAEEDEVCIVFMSGEATMEVSGEHTYQWHLQGRTSVFGNAPHVVYLPPHHSYRLTSHTKTEVAYARARERDVSGPVASFRRHTRRATGRQQYPNTSWSR